MIPAVSIYQDLFDHNDWAHARIFAMCDGLSDEQLDRSRAMGLGSLRNTLFHNLEAEKLWLERWQGQAWRPLQVDARGASVAEIAQQAAQVAEKRNALIRHESRSGFSRVVQFQDLRRRAWSFPVGRLLHHVANHGVHHRAQALSFLRSFERTVPAGLDYLFWKLARPSCTLPEQSVEPLRAYGLEAAAAQGKMPEFDRDTVQAYFDYGDWAMRQVLLVAEPLNDAQLDQPFEMGPGSLRKTLEHLLNAERWWNANWAKDHSPFPKYDVPLSLSEMKSQLGGISEQRNEFVQSLDEGTASRIVNITAGGPPTCLRVTESMLQLGSHGTHHRAQCLNMLRQLKVVPPAIDLIDWLRANTQ